MVGGAGIVGIVGLGAVGGILANIALTPLTAGASLLQSYWYGSGLILGERMMYTVHWEKIKGRLDKGEDFLQVLDVIMNDDITAIANLSFKAMDETGKLYLDKAGTAIAEFVDKLLTAIITPFPSVNVETEPAPSGESTPEGISLTIAQIQAMSTNTLLFETQPNQITKYTEATQAHMLTEKLSRDITDETTQEEEQTVIDFKYDLFQSEIAFLQELVSFQDGSIENIYANFITKHSSEQQTTIINWLKIYAIYNIFTIRTVTDGSNQKLKELRDQLLEWRNRNIASPSTKNQSQINAIHVTIFLWQMIYSR